ncbi:MAG: cytochrome b [Saprospiraceae bacterium]|nr:cytochrome b [Saprospiraceae bacterium]
MYTTVLALHSIFRWLVLISLVIAIFQAYKGWILKKPFLSKDNAIRHWTATIAHVQLMIGLWLYFVSPQMDYFMKNFKEAVHQKDIRFFGMEHSIMMVVAIVLITIGSVIAKRKSTDQDKFKTIAIWFTIGLIIILISIPWSFSPFVSRPNFRSF